jgi:cytochrome c
MQRNSTLAVSILALLASVGALPSSVSAQGVQGAGAGATFFESRCVACHSLDTNRVGPMLRGVVGRKVASVPGYEYSDALKRVSGRWDVQRLEKWLTDPQSVAPGTKMVFSLASTADRAAVIQYLASTSVPSGAAKR